MQWKAECFSIGFFGENLVVQMMFGLRFQFQIFKFFRKKIYFFQFFFQVKTGKMDDFNLKIDVKNFFILVVFFEFLKTEFLEKPIFKNLKKKFFQFFFSEFSSKNWIF